MNATESILAITKSFSSVDVYPEDPIDAACLDSLQLLEVQSTIERQFRVRMDRELFGIHSFKEWGDYIEQMIESTGRSFD